MVYNMNDFAALIFSYYTLIINDVGQTKIVAMVWNSSGSNESRKTENYM